MRRRAFLAWTLGCATLARAFEPVEPGRALVFPQDRGAHPGHRIEWWYMTGHLDTPSPLGFQVTFFRVRNKEAENLPGRFSPRQLLFAHAAVTDIAAGKLRHDQRAARLLGGLVYTREGETDVRLDDWTLRRDGASYRTRIDADGFAMELLLTPTQAPLLQGDGGFSRKGPRPEQASYYYSEPHLEVTGRVALEGRDRAVRGRAWLDHEWSSELLAAEATGWDWLGANLEDGGALTVFRVRDAKGGSVWATALHRDAAGVIRRWSGADVTFVPQRRWTSSRTGVSYPVAPRIEIGGEAWNVTPLIDDQELDARASTGTLYWEGAVRVAGPRGAQGRGYLELTGYSERVPF